METIFVRYFDAYGEECIEKVPAFDTVRLADLLSIGGEVIPQ